jgi:hypothetical protein
LSSEHSVRGSGCSGLLQVGLVQAVYYKPLQSFVGGLRFELRALCGLCHLSHTSSHFCFRKGLVFWPGVGLDHDSPTYTSCIGGITGMPQNLAYLLRWGHTNFLPRLASNLDPPNRHFPCGWDYRWSQHV